MPLGERHVVLTEHVCNERGESINLTQPISRLCGSTSLTSQPSAIDHLVILKYSQQTHNNN